MSDPNNMRGLTLADMNDTWNSERQAGDFTIHLIGIAVAGAPKVTEFRIKGDPRPDGAHVEVTREVLAEVARNLTRLADEAYAEFATTTVTAGILDLGTGELTPRQPGRPLSPGKNQIVSVNVERQPEDAAHMAAQLQAGRRRRLTREDLQEVAEVYLDAKTDGKPVTAAVAASRHVTASRAAHLIKEARKAGLLPPVQPRGNSNAEDE